MVELRFNTKENDLMEDNNLYQFIRRRIEDDQIHINDSNRDAIEEVVMAIVNEEAFGDESKLNAVMLKGLPGTGKGYTAQWMRTKVSDILGQDIPMISVGSVQSPEDVMTLYKNAREIAQQRGRCIIWDDEVDKRGKRGETGDSAKEAVLNQFLIEMQSANSNNAVITLCCTNRPDRIDPAYRRGKRCGKEIVFDPLDRKGRKHLSEIEAFRRDHHFIFGEEDIDYIVSKSYGAVGADISQLFTDSATYANLKLYRSLKDIAHSLLVEEIAEGEIAQLMETLGLENLLVGAPAIVGQLCAERVEWSAKEGASICADDPLREKKLVERYARQIFTVLNPNKKSGAEAADNAGEKKVVRWIRVDRECIDHVLEHFVPSALKDMPFEETSLTFDYFGGMDAPIRYLKQIAENTIAQDKEGTTLLLCGGEGLGVTSLARAVAGEYGYNLIVLYGADQESKWVGEVKDRLLEINDRAKASKPCVVVFDNLQYLAMNTSGYDQPHKQTATSALKQIIRPTKGVIYIATVESPDQLDASMRALFKRSLTVEPPKTIADYLRIWESNINKDNLPSEGVDLARLAELSTGSHYPRVLDMHESIGTGLTGGDINNICRFFTELGVAYSEDALVSVVQRYLDNRQQGIGAAANDMDIAGLIIGG